MIVLLLLILMGLGIAFIIYPLLLIFVNLFSLPLGTLTSFILTLIIVITFIYAINAKNKKGQKQ